MKTLAALSLLFSVSAFGSNGVQGGVFLRQNRMATVATMAFSGRVAGAIQAKVQGAACTQLTDTAVRCVYTLDTSGSLHADENTNGVYVPEMSVGSATAELVTEGLKITVKGRPARALDAVVLNSPNGSPVKCGDIQDDFSMSCSFVLPVMSETTQQ